MERFRDEIGDWRVCVLTPFGGRVHAPWSMALAARLRDSLGVEVQSLWSDDGIALHFPDADVPPSVADLLVEPQELEDLVVQEVGATALFGARFRENAARALLIPRRRPGQRTPLWQQRLKAQSLLEVARKYGSFPIILETYRECLQDVFDLPALRGILRGLQTREIDLVEVETPSASPMAASLLFDYVATYMYEDDTPAAERRAQALSLDRELLRELLGQEELRDLLDPGALAEVEASLMPASRGTRTSCTTSCGGPATCATGELDPGFAETLVRERRAFRARIGGGGRRDRGRGRRALPRRVRRDAAGGLPEAFLEAVDDAAGTRPRALRASRGPFTTRDVASRFARETTTSSAVLAALEARDLLVRGELRPGGVEREWCDPDVLRRIRRASLAVLRRRGRAGGAGGVGALPAVVARDRPARDAARSARSAAGARAAGRRSGRPRSCRGGSRAISRPCSTSSARPGRSSGSAPVSTASPLYFREDAPLLGPPGRPSRSPGARCTTRSGPRSRGSAEFWPDLVAATALEVEDGAARALGARLGRRGDERRLGAAPGRSGATACRARRAAAAPLLALARARRRGDAGPLVAHRRAVRQATLRPPRARGAPARAAGDRDPRRRPRRGDPGRLRRRLRASCGRSRRSARAAAATSSRGSAARSSRSPGAVERLRELRRREARSPRRSCSPPPIRRSRTARRCRGRDARARAPPAWPARMSCCSAARRRSSSSGAAARSCRCASPTRSGCGPRSRRSSRTWVRAGAKRLAVERFDGRPVVESDVMPLLVEAGFLPVRAGRCCAHRWLIGNSREPAGAPDAAPDHPVRARPVPWGTSPPRSPSPPTWVRAAPDRRARLGLLRPRTSRHLPINHLAVGPDETGRSPRIAPLRFPCRTVYGEQPAAPSRRQHDARDRCGEQCGHPGPGPERRPVDVVATRGRRRRDRPG